MRGSAPMSTLTWMRSSSGSSGGPEWGGGLEGGVGAMMRPPSLHLNLDLAGRMARHVLAEAMASVSRTPVPVPAAVASAEGVTDDSLASLLDTNVLHIKRTFQPSLWRRKRKHGFLARARTRNGVKVLNRRKQKGRRKLCA